MEEIKITWQLLSLIGVFCGAIVGLVKYIGNRIQSSVDKLVDTTNSHTTVIAIETKRNDDQDKRLDEHGDEIDSIKEKIWQVTYRRA